MAVKIITGTRLENNVQSADDGARIYGTISSGDRVLDAGEKFDYQIITNNCVRIKSGEVLMQGRHVRQAPGTYTDLTIDNGAQGMKRNDIIILRYTKNAETDIENAELAVIKGTPGVTAVDPEITTGDIYEGCLLHEMAMYRVSLDGLSIDEVTQLFSKLERPGDRIQPIEKGGTGATTPSSARTNLGVSGTVLYNNASGTTGTLTLSDSCANYEFLEIIFKNFEGRFSSQRMYSPNGATATLETSNLGDSGWFFRGRVVSFSGKTLTAVCNRQAWITDTVGGSGLTESIRITKVIGYKYI